MLLLLLLLFARLLACWFVRLLVCLCLCLFAFDVSLHLFAVVCFHLSLHLIAVVCFDLLLHLFAVVCFGSVFLPFFAFVLLACLPACLLACLPACLLACLPACLLFVWLVGWLVVYLCLRVPLICLHCFSSDVAPFFCRSAPWRAP